MTHPNAAVAGAAGGAAAGLVSVLEVFGVSLPVTAALAIVAAAPTAALFVGKRGIKGIARLLWQGES